MLTISAQTTAAGADAGSSNAAPVILMTGVLFVVGVAIFAPRRGNMKPSMMLPETNFPVKSDGPKWVTPRREERIAELWKKYGERCLQGHWHCPDESHFIVEETLEGWVAVAEQIPLRSSKPTRERPSQQMGIRLGSQDWNGTAPSRIKKKIPVSKLLREVRGER